MNNIYICIYNVIIYYHKKCHCWQDIILNISNILSYTSFLKNFQ